jgi:hypothetical protein
LQDLVETISELTFLTHTLGFILPRFLNRVAGKLPFLSAIRKAVTDPVPDPFRTLRLIQILATFTKLILGTLLVMASRTFG